MFEERAQETLQGGPFADPQWAWARYQPGNGRPWSLRWAGHLVRRAGFGASWSQLQRAVEEGPQRSVDRLLHPEAEADEFNQTYDEYELSSAGDLDALQAWWLRRMMLTPHPLLEKMTLFWHGHFAIGPTGATSLAMTARHVQSLRRHALGRFGAMLRQVSQDPATLLGLEAGANRMSRPSQPLARAVLEAFTVGPGACSPQDIRDAARAFTGCFILQQQLRQIDREHDPGDKEILGQRGPWKGDDVLRIALAHPATSRHLVRKLYRWFISETTAPGDALVAALAEPLAKDFDVPRTIEVILRSNLFFSAAAYRQRIKSPVEFAVGLVRGLDGTIAVKNLGQDLEHLGQGLYRPPSIEGWHGGESWLNRATLAARHNLAWAMLTNTDRYGDKLNPVQAAAKQGRASPREAARLFLDVFLQGDLDRRVLERLLSAAASVPSADAATLRKLVHGIVAMPEFQLA